MFRSPSPTLVYETRPRSPSPTLVYETRPRSPSYNILSPAPATTPAYAFDDNPVWPPPGGTDCGCIIPQYVEPGSMVSVIRRVSVPDQTVIIAPALPTVQNIDNPRVQATTLGTTGASFDPVVVHTDRWVEPGSVRDTLPYISRPQSVFNPTPPAIYNQMRPPMVNVQRHKPVDMNRAIGFGIVATCLCPPLGLAALGTGYE